ncbi:hypothetical protein Aco03nite_092750 [Actinoplanes couchii]|uniref:Mini-circle protein n=1 Tax=Actinoplanes couchii TaxID=403638 RepID=A0ABQ3XQS1_9ACTN|nr:hypothetical protein Aco03nite_092750 [Actinoplanes couchii]
MRRRLVMSDTTLLGLVQHLTGAERYWFGDTVAGTPRYADASIGMTVAEDQPAERVIADYRTTIGDSDVYVRAAGDLDFRTAQSVNEEPRTLRWALAHMTCETTRHADILRGLIDGVTGH